MQCLLCTAPSYAYRHDTQAMLCCCPAAIYALGGVPGAFILWYMRVYNAAIKDSAFGYAIFFAGFMAHLVFVGWSAIGASSLAAPWGAVCRPGQQTHAVGPACARTGSGDQQDSQRFQQE